MSDTSVTDLSVWDGEDRSKTRFDAFHVRNSHWEGSWKFQAETYPIQHCQWSRFGYTMYQTFFSNLRAIFDNFWLRLETRASKLARPFYVAIPNDIVMAQSVTLSGACGCASFRRNDLWRCAGNDLAYYHNIDHYISRAFFLIIAGNHCNWSSSSHRVKFV